VAALLADAQELDTHLQLSVPGDVAALALAGASGAVRSYCGWGLLRENATFTVPGSGSVVLSLPTLHLRSVGAVRIDGLTVSPGDLAGIVAHPQGQLIWAASWPYNSVVEVDCDHGYDETPDVVRLVVLTLATRLINNPDNVKSASVGTVTRTYDAALTQMDIRLLDPYRLE
jgi:hypothetical protein